MYVLDEPGTTLYMLYIYLRFEVALQQNEIMDVFFDDWQNLADEDSSFGSKADNHLKVSSSFFTWNQIAVT